MKIQEPVAVAHEVMIETAAGMTLLSAINLVRRPGRFTEVTGVELRSGESGHGVAITIGLKASARRAAKVAAKLAEEALATLTDEARAKVTDESALRPLAESIASDLFTNGQGEYASQLRLTSATGRYLGGWCEGAVRDRILDQLVEAALAGRAVERMVRQ